MGRVRGERMYYAQSRRGAVRWRRRSEVSGRVEVADRESLPGIAGTDDEEDPMLPGGMVQ
jgi:hypothetical protein